jgi:nucleotide-binding universal stress UspA family protein
MKRILAAIDDSGIAASVVAEASALAHATGAKVLLLRVIPEFAEPPVPNIFEPAGDTGARIAAAENALSLQEANVPEGHRGGVIVELGEAWKTICRIAREQEVDLVLIGAHRYRFAERVLGTTAAKVVNHVDRPVLVIRPPPQAASKTALENSRGMEAAATTLKAEHARLEEVYAAMLTAFRQGDWLDVREQWSAFEATVRKHMAFEESSIFPAFRISEPRAIPPRRGTR